MTVLAVVALCGLLAPVIAPHEPGSSQLRDAFTPPVWSKEGSWKFPLGTDELGRDILSRLIYGCRYSLLIAAASIVIGATLGVTVGLCAGYFGGKVDAVLMRIVDLMLSLPMILLALVLASLSGPSFRNVLVVLGLFLWGQYARQVRGEALSLRERGFIRLAKTFGRHPAATMVQHLLPNVRDTIIVLATLQLAVAILLESSLSFLGVGMPPSTPAWGLMVAGGVDHISRALWISFIPGATIAAMVVAINFTGDWLRDRLDPKLRQL